jgi:glycosyltransferase involved in cell wall biosynthesis
VLAADAGALPEVVGEAGLLFPVGDIRAIADGIRMIVTEPTTTAEMVSAGRDQANQFTPGMAARQLWAVYRQLLDLSPDSSSADLPGASPSETSGDGTGETQRRS